MKWKENSSVFGLCLVLIAWGLTIFDAWPVLVARLNLSNWIMIGLIHLGVLLGLIGLCTQAPKSTRARSQALLITALVVMSWSINMYLMEKIGRGTIGMGTIGTH